MNYCRIGFKNTTRNYSFNRLIKKVIDKTLELEGVKNECKVLFYFTNDETIKKLNKKYRGKNKPTDVLSFPMLSKAEIIMPQKASRVMLGEIIISIETAERNAEQYNHSPEREIAFLTVHSILHLLGYDHEESENEMFEKQNRILNSLNILRTE